MNTGFAPLASITVSHAYYGTGCRDIEFVPSGETSDLLRAGRMLLRVVDGNLHLLYQAESVGVPTSNIAGRTLYFGLRLQNPYFVNFTTPVIADGSLTPFYDNAATPTVLSAPRGVTLVAGRYAHEPQLPTRPVTLRLSDASNHTLDSRTLIAGEVSTSYEFFSYPPGSYQLQEDYGAGVLRNRELLLEPTLRDLGVWGVLALYIDAGFYSAAAGFSLSFSARKEALRYYLVASNFSPAEFAQISVVDAGHNAAGGGTLGFTRIAPPFPANAGFIETSLLGDGSAQIAVFQSQSEVERKERGLKKIHLSRNATVLIEHLPLPGAERAKADLIVYLSKP
jgi:hypothetical protein